MILPGFPDDVLIFQEEHHSQTKYSIHREISSVNSKKHGPLCRMSINESLVLSIFVDSSNTMHVLVVSPSDFITYDEVNSRLTPKFHTFIYFFYDIFLKVIFNNFIIFV